MGTQEAVKYTSGPWYVDGFNGRHEYIRQVSDSDVCVAQMPHWHDEHRNELQANARLIAAAPEILEALEALLPFLPDRNAALNYAATNDGRVGASYVAVDQARAIIRKAKGEL